MTECSTLTYYYEDVINLKISGNHISGKMKKTTDTAEAKIK